MPPRGGHKNKFFQFLKTLLESISRALLKVLKPFFSKLPLDRTFCRGTRLLCTFPDASAKGQHFSALVPTIYFVELWLSGQALKSAVLRRTRREKCRKVLKGRGSRRRVMPTREPSGERQSLEEVLSRGELERSFLNFFKSPDP